MKLKEQLALEAILDTTPCPKCGAEAGKACVSALGRKWDQGIHNARRAEHQRRKNNV